MRRPAAGRLGGTPGAIAAAVLLAALPAAPPAGAQVEVRAAERTEELARIELDEVPLRRHLVSDQLLALWLPDGWDRLSGDTDLVTFSSTGAARYVQVSRIESEPGAALGPTLQDALEGLRGNGILEEVESIRRIRLAGRDALEAAGTGTPGEDREPARLVVAIDPDREHFRMIIVRGPETPDDPLDALYERVIRDFAPLDGTGWTGGLERRRQGLIADAPSAAWDDRNRLFEAASRPEAIGQAWIEERLRELAEEDPHLLFDGLFHHHPRVRIACIEALGPAAIGEPVRTELFAALTTDGDPAVRFRAARRIAGSPAAGDVLGRVLETDSETARAAAFQLLAAAPEPRRAELAVDAFAERRQYPEATQPLLAVLLAAWAPPEKARTLLGGAWKRSRSESLRRAAWLELLGLGDPEALADARRRLGEPLAPRPLSLRAAAAGLAVHAEAGDGVEPWRSLAESLANALEAEPGDEVEDESAADLEAAGETVAELVAHLESLPVPATREAECDALAPAGDDTWAGARRRRLDCPFEVPTALVHATVPEPGPYGFALLELLDRLHVGSEMHNQAFHALVERLGRRVSHWFGDPVTTASTGIDLDAPWELRWWHSINAFDDAGDDEPDAAAPDSGRSAVSLRLTGGDPERLTDTLLRGASGRFELDGLARGLLFSNALALMPAVTVALWDAEQETLTGTDDASSTPAPTERFLAAGPAEPWGDEHEHRALHALEIDPEEGSRWRVGHLFWRGDEAVLTDVPAPGLAPAPRLERTAAGEEHSSRIEVDLAALLERLGSDEVPPELAGRDLTFSTGTALEPEAIATGFRVDGLPEEWLTLGVNVAPGELRAPAELLPEGSVAWLGVVLSPGRLEELLREDAPELLEDVRAISRRRLLRLARHFQGEAGVAVVGPPDPSREQAGEAWGELLVGYLAIEPAETDRFLRRTGRERRTVEGRTVHRLDDELWGARAGGFLVLGSSPDALAALGRPPYLAGGPLFQRLVERAPAEALLWAGFDNDRLADAVIESVRRRDDSGASEFPIEISRALGDIAGWVRAEEAALIGELSTDPRLQSEENRTRVRQLAAYGDLAWGSVGARGMPAAAIDGLPRSALEMTLRLPDDLPPVALEWRSARLDQEEVEAGLYRFVSREAAELPGESDLALPITGPDLLPYGRNEHNLDLHSTEIQELAETIRGDETDPARIVRAIVDWAHESLDYTVIRDSVGAERTLATRQADCTEFSQLTIALARSLGIPARPVHGVVIGAEAAYFHQWAEVHLDRWYEIDPTWGTVRVPATHLRIPLDDGRFLASLPQARFTVQAVETAGGGWARRLPVEPAARNRGDGAGAAVAVAGERVLVVLPEASRNGTAGERRLLESADGGRTFIERAPPEPAGEPVQVLGGHGRIVWLQRAGEPARLTAFELDGGAGWRRLRLPPAFASTAEWTLGHHPDGWLALAGGAEPRLLRLAPDLARAEAIALPAGGAGEWALGREEGLLARSVEGEGIDLHRWNGGGWAAPLAVADTADLVALGVREAGERVEVIARPRGGEVTIRLTVAADGAAVRRGVPPQEATALAASTATADGIWTVWVAERDRLLIHRPLAAAADPAAGNPAGAPEADSGR